MERYGLAVQFTDEREQAGKHDVETAVGDWLRQEARKFGVTVDIEQLLVEQETEEEQERDAANARLLASVGRQLDWEATGKIKRTYPVWRVKAVVSVNARITDRNARQLTEAARERLRVNNMTEARVSIYRLS